MKYRLRCLLQKMKKFNYCNITVGRIYISRKPNDVSFFGYIDNHGMPFGIGYYSTENIFVIIRTLKKQHRKIISEARELLDKDLECIPKIILDSLIETASTKKAKYLYYWYVNYK